MYVFYSLSSLFYQNEKLEILIQAHGELDLSISSLSRDLTKLDQRKIAMKKAHETLLRNRKTISTLNGKFPSSLEAFDALHYLYLQNQTQTLGKFEWDWNYGKVMRDLVCLFTDELYQDSGIHCGDMVGFSLSNSPYFLSSRSLTLSLLMML